MKLKRGIKIEPEKENEIIANFEPGPLRQARSVLVRPHTGETKSSLNQAFASCKGAVARTPTILEPYIEQGKEFKRVYAISRGQGAFKAAFDAFDSHARRFERQGVRLCLYISASEALKKILSGPGKDYTWCATPNDDFLIYPRKYNLTVSWADSTLQWISKKITVLESGIAIEFPTE